jgi:hypothetical protein
MKLKIERFEQKKLVLFYNDEYYGIFNNEHEFNLFRIQMVQNKCTDLYKINFNDQFYSFDKYGSLIDWPNGLYDESLSNYANLFKLRKQIIQNERDIIAL